MMCTVMDLSHIFTWVWHFYS